MPPLLFCSAADFQGMSSFAWPAVMASAVLAPIEQTPFETWDDCGRFCAPKPVKCRCAEQCLKLTCRSDPGRTVRKHQLPQLWHQSSQQHAGQVVPYQQCFLCREQTSNTKCVLRDSWNTCRHKLDASRSESQLHQVLFPHKKRITERCSLRDDFNGNASIFKCLQMTSQWRHRNKTHSWYSELNSLQNVYFRFFILGKLTEWHHFVTYLWNDPRIFTIILLVCEICLHVFL